jgi:hypothetical protein
VSGGFRDPRRRVARAVPSTGQLAAMAGPRAKLAATGLPTSPVRAAAAVRAFFKKGFKKIKFEKGVLIWKISKNGYLLPDQRAGGVGPETSRPSNGREVLNFFLSPS